LDFVHIPLRKERYIRICLIGKPLQKSAHYFKRSAWQTVKIYTISDLSEKEFTELIYLNIERSQVYKKIFSTSRSRHSDTLVSFT